mgnify:CR=1 FL=1
MGNLTNAAKVDRALGPALSLEQRRMELVRIAEDRMTMAIRQRLQQGLENLAGFYPELAEKAILAARAELRDRKNKAKPITLTLLKMLPQFLDQVKRAEQTAVKDDPMAEVLRKLEAAQHLILRERTIETSGTPSTKTPA